MTNKSGNVTTPEKGDPPGRSSKPKGRGGIYFSKTRHGLVRINDKMKARASDLTQEQVRGLKMTAAQSEVYLAVEVFWEKYGFGPSLSDIALIRGKKSAGNTKRIVDALVDLGALKYLPNKKRSVRPVHLKFRNLQ